MFSTLYTQGNRGGLQGLVTKVSHWIFWPTLAIALFLLGFSEQILGVFGPQFTAARLPMIVLAGGNFFNALAGSVGYLLVMTGHQKQIAARLGVSALTNVVLNAVFIPKFGSLGAAIATSLTMVMWNIWLYRLVVKKLGIHASILAYFLTKLR